MTSIVVEVGPVTIRGPHSADAQCVSASIDGIDDELALVEDRPVDVADLWRTVMHDVIGDFAEEIVLVVPTWWATPRVERVYKAASTAAGHVAVVRRTQVLADRISTVVEIAPEVVVVSPPAGEVHVVPRGDADAIVARIPTSTGVLIDSPEGVEGAALLAAAVADRLRANGIAVVIADGERVRRSVASASRQARPCGREAGPNRRRRATALAAGTLLSAAALCGGFAARQPHPPTAMPMTLLVEGRVGVMVPARWAVERITSGPGSARLQVVSPDDADVAVHITQSPLVPEQSLEQVGESLRTALREQPDGVFVDFNPSGRRAEQPVVTYREIRRDRHITWAVLVDKSLRIAIGCQSAPAREDAVRVVCEQAIQSAHALF